VELHLVLRVGRERQLLRERHAGGGRVDEEQVDVVGAVARPGEDDDVRRRARVRHVPLRPVEDEPVALRTGPELHALRREPVARLEPGRSEDLLAGDDARQPRLLLLRAPGPDEHPGAQHRGDEVRRRHQAAPELLVHDRAFDEAHLRAAVLGGQQQPDEVELGELLPEVGGEPGRVVLELPDSRER
jgi:hypothetical protein